MHSRTRYTCALIGTETLQLDGRLRLELSTSMALCFRILDIRIYHQGLVKAKWPAKQLLSWPVAISLEKDNDHSLEIVDIGSKTVYNIFVPVDCA